MIKKIISILAAVCICGTGAQADFVAYNDFGGTSPGNTTAISLNQSGLLKNYSSGANTSVTLNVVNGSPASTSDPTTGASPTSGDAFSIFNGKINMAGYIWYNNVTTVPYSNCRLDLTGLDQNKTYEIVVTANRDNTAYQGVDVRYTRFTVSDADSFTNSHSNGTTLATVTTANDSVNVGTGYNTSNGHVARWFIKSGSDGDFSVTVTAPTGTGASGDGKWYLGAMRLTETSTYEYQDGLNGYTGTVDTFLQQVNPNMNHSLTTPLKWDNDDGGAGFDDYPLIRFDNIFGTGPGQIQPSDTITSATLFYNVGGDANATGNNATFHEVLVNWAESDTFNTFGGEADVQPDEYGPSLGTAAGGALGVVSVDVTSSITAWKTNTSANRGWMFRPTGTDGVQITSRENGTVSIRPRLSVLINSGVPAQKTLLVKHEPYLQLGNAPLVNTGAGIGTTDQIVIAWQTVEAGTGSSPNDYFEVEYRPVGAGGYTPVSPISTLDVAVETRVNRSVTITGLNYDSDFEYKVHHKRNPSSPVLVTTYDGTFHTRKHPSSNASFSFAAYGDSANMYSPGEQANFQSVANRISLLQSAFVVLLGDNIYTSGTHAELDARLSASLASNNSAYIRNHIEYWCNGNHDAGTLGGLPSIQNYYCPFVIQGVTSPVAPASGEVQEDNYSFDYGLVHFTILDSCAWGGPGETDSRQAAIVNWMAADLAASNQPWKIVAAHHPPKSYMGNPDAPGAMACEVFPTMIANGADLLLVGHSHNYQRSFPLIGHSAAPSCSGGEVTYIADQSGTYIKGGQVIEVVAGTGGENIGGVAPNSATGWLAKAFGSNNGGETGPLVIDVTPSQLTIKYISGATGTIKDQFQIVQPSPMIALSPTTINRTVFLGDNLPNDSFDVDNFGTGTINYSINDSAAWLDESPNSGASSGESDPISIIYSVSTLPFGNNQATISVTAPEASNNPQTVIVNVNVVSVRPDFDGDGDVDNSDFGHLQRCFSGTAIPLGPGCANADVDLSPDNDVDAQDLAIFFNCMSGPNILASRTCDD